MCPSGEIPPKRRTFPRQQPHPFEERTLATKPDGGRIRNLSALFWWRSSVCVWPELLVVIELAQSRLLLEFFFPSVQSTHHGFSTTLPPQLPAKARQLTINYLTKIYFLPRCNKFSFVRFAFSLSLGSVFGWISISIPSCCAFSLDTPRQRQRQYLCACFLR